MKFCPECHKSPLPFFMAIFVAGVSAFLTWLTLSYSQFDAVERVAGSALVFVAVGATIMHYMLRCIKRHCRHDHDTAGRQSTAH